MTANVLKACSSPIPGNDPELIMINYADIESVSYDPANTRIVKDIVLKAGKKAYKIEGFKTSVKSKSELVIKPYGGYYKHTIDFLGYDLTVHGKKQYEALDFGRSVAIVKHLYDQNADGATVYDVYGLGSGLWGTADVSDKNDDNTGGSFAITVATFEPNGEQHLPATFFDTDLATTTAKIQAKIYSGTSGS